MTKESGLDIKSVLELIDKNEFDLYASLREDEDLCRELKTALGYVLPMYMVGAVKPDVHRELVIEFNKNCNVGYYRYSRHPMLQYKLLATVGPGRRVQHRFYKTSRDKQFKLLFDFFRDAFSFDIRREEIELWCRQNTEKDFQDCLARNGFQESDRTVLMKEFIALQKAMEKTSNAR